MDRVYQRSLPKHVPNEIEETATPTSTDIVSASVPKDEPYSFQRHLQFQPDYEKSHHRSQIRARRSPLSSIFDKASISIDDAVFIPQDEDKPFPLASLPSELLEPIFSNLDLASLERFGLTCWRARYLTSRAGIWKKRVSDIYRYPMIPKLDNTVGSVTSNGHEIEHGVGGSGSDTKRNLMAIDLAKRHDGEWRTTFVEEERIRMDGCYISVCHYLRPGAGDEWVAVTHMITYHRFLRFYPDGTVISFLTTDQYVPPLPQGNHPLPRADMFQAPHQWYPSFVPPCGPKASISGNGNSQIPKSGSPNS